MKNRRKLIATVVGALALSVAVAACGGDDDGGSEEGGGDGGGGDVSIGYASPVATQPNQINIQNGMERAAESLGWEYEVLDSDLSPDQQVSNVDTMITTGRDGIVSWTLDPGALDAAYERAADESIPLVGLNSEGEFINTDIQWETYECEDDGSKQATVDFIIENAGEGARILVIGPPPVPVLVGATECFIERAEAAGLEVVDREDNVEDQVATATPIVEDLLSKHENIDALWSYNDTTTIGAGGAIENAGLEVQSPDTPDGIITIGGNGDAEAIEAIEAGRMTMTWDTLAAETGAAAIRALAVVFEDGGDPSEMPERIVLDSVMITAENVDEFVNPDERELDLDDLPILREE